MNSTGGLILQLFCVTIVAATVAAVAVQVAVAASSP
jgi:hypothetical protein